MLSQKMQDAMNELSPWEQSALGDELTGTPSLALVA